MSRFNWIYDHSPTPAQAWNQDLTPGNDFATLPTVGSIVSDWLLFIPRQRVSAIAHLSAECRMRLLDHAKQAMLVLQERTGRGQIAFFEHGAINPGSLTGCGVDHAHLHGVLLPFSLTELFAHDRMDAVKVSDSDIWTGLGEKDYLLCVDDEGALSATPRHPQSQYFRRLIAEHVGRPAEWDYKQYPFENNIQKTLQHFHEQS